MKKLLVAGSALLVLATGSAYAEGPNAVEMPRISRPIMAGQSGIDSGSETTPVFSGKVAHGSFTVVSDTGSTGMPTWVPSKPTVKLVNR